ncbi:flavodoxin domain-containing protein [Clostridium sp. UBA1652]|uniref:flavodoxin domain-containing protein n=1 Tax=Clostridium sp. UBA1652 TaxID=1946348 RepID=UPI00257E0693|nr:flavodoxin family protein [Clostridium sp. UBA1652]
MINKIGIVYASKTGHCKKIAKAIGKTLNIEPKNIKDNSILEDMDLLFIVSGIYGGESLLEVLKFAENLDNKKVKRVALITSSTSKKKGQGNILKVLEEKNIKVVDELLSQGSFLIMKLGHPNRQDIKEAEEFSIRIRKKLEG